MPPHNLGRLNDAGADGLAVIGQMQAIASRYGPRTRLLVASVRSRGDFLALLEIGVGAITIPVSLAVDLLENPSTLAAEAAFLQDAESVR